MLASALRNWERTKPNAPSLPRQLNSEVADVSAKAGAKDRKEPSPSTPVTRELNHEIPETHELGWRRGHRSSTGLHQAPGIARCGGMADLKPADDIAGFTPCGLEIRDTAECNSALLPELDAALPGMAVLSFPLALLAKLAKIGSQSTLGKLPLRTYFIDLWDESLTTSLKPLVTLRWSA